MPKLNILNELIVYPLFFNCVITDQNHLYRCTQLKLFFSFIYLVLHVNYATFFSLLMHPDMILDNSKTKIR